MEQSANCTGNLYGQNYRDVARVMSRSLIVSSIPMYAWSPDLYANAPALVVVLPRVGPATVQKDFKPRGWVGSPDSWKNRNNKNHPQAPGQSEIEENIFLNHHDKMDITVLYFSFHHLLYDTVYLIYPKPWVLLERWAVTKIM